MGIVGILLLVIHIIICIVVYLLMRAGILKSTRMIMPLVCMVPAAGLAALLVLEIRSRGKQEILEEVGIEKLKINDEIHRSILMDEDPVEDRIVPLEEALLINEPSARRELMMEIMYANPSDYVEQLKEASLNDDTEVVHYAVTALSELQKEYDLQFQELEWEIRKHPEDTELEDRYISLLGRYLGSGLAEGNARNIKLRDYSDMLGRRLETRQDSLRLYRDKVETDLQIKEYGKAYQVIQEILGRWEKNEAGYLLLLRYYAAMNSRAGIDSVLGMIERKGIYLSPEGRTEVRFWQKG